MQRGQWIGTGSFLAIATLFGCGGSMSLNVPQQATESELSSAAASPVAIHEEPPSDKTVQEGYQGNGRMTGGGQIRSPEGGVRHGFELHCHADDPRQNLEVNWGRGQRFHLTSLVDASCSTLPDTDEGSPVAGFNTFVGAGYGEYNGQPGATIQFLFTDNGEPGRQDAASLVVFDPNGKPVLAVGGPLAFGNQQAHPEEVAKGP